jgi:negative regulator of flagellin synthesis FlgM
MEINKNPVALNTAISRLDVQQQNVRSQRAGEDGAPSNSDRIELSVRGREIQQLDEMIRSTPDIRTARVEQVRQALESGTYNVKAEMIADKIIGGDLIDEVF